MQEVPPNAARLAPPTTPPMIPIATDIQDSGCMSAAAEICVDFVGLPGQLQEDVTGTQGLRSSLKTSEAWNKPVVAFADPGDATGPAPNSPSIVLGTGSNAVRPSRETNLSLLSGLPCRFCCCYSRHTVRLLRRRLRPFVAHKAFQGLLIVSLFFALFGGNIWLLLEIPDDPGIDVLDAIMTVILLLFVLEMVLLSITEYRTYMWSFFFWMDLLGSASMVFEISFLLGTSDELTRSDRNVDTTLMRTARATKVGARVGRLTKLTKFIKWMTTWAGKKYDKGANVSDAQEQASNVSKHVMFHLSAKVALLSIVLIMIVPLFSLGDYPQDDWSIRAWSQRIEKEYARLHDAVSADSSLEYTVTTDMFLSVLQSAESFYDDVSYFPFKVEGYEDEFNINGLVGQLYMGPAVFHGSTPKLNQFMFKQEVPSCELERPSCNGGGSRAYVLYNRRVSTRTRAAMDMLMIVFILFVMLGVTFDLSRTIHRMLMLPLERMLALVKTRAEGIFSTVVAMESAQAHADGDSEVSVESNESIDINLAAMSELDMLEIALEKLAVVGNLLVSDEVVDKATMENLDLEGRGVIAEILRMGPARNSSQLSSYGEGPSGVEQSTTSSYGKLPVELTQAESWDLDMLALTHGQAAAIVEWALFDSRIGDKTGKHFADRSVFVRFLAVVEAEYQDQPYHNFMHACDVCHTVYRLLSEVQSDSWLSVLEQYGLLVASICHDIGHPGRTNVFLMQTKDPLAILYNDQSPLENMHCARLFAIGLDVKTQLFASLSTEAYREVRKVCISTILHTDNAHHFQMVKDISRVYELYSELCEAQADSAPSFSTKYVAEVLKKDSILWLKLFLHLADVSNPMKPFPVCKAWAWRVLDEFFAQGDEEKTLGIPVGMLNDRDKTNRPGSQHGFINFLVNPFLQGSIRIFPMLHPLLTQMAQNLADWQALWEEDANPSAEEKAKRTAEVQKVQEQSALLATWPIEPIAVAS